MNDRPRLDFQRIAIVNRGEPALRLLRAVRDWNAERGERLRTIALYTEPDRDALFVREADDAFPLGPAMFLDNADLDENGKPRRKSRYLDLERLREALLRTRAEAAWVGWGFVAEHAGFAELCRELNVAFIGPTPEAMRRLGDKIGSKRLAEKAKVPVAPWSGGPLETLGEAREVARRLGYPLLVKASAGGGGRGIRFVSAEPELEGAFRSASAEARKAFGDGTVFLESRVVGARHVEVQVVADMHGTVWAAGVRDCSVQRSNQKVLEEAPSTALPPAAEERLRAAAVSLAKAAGYLNAGTAEFLYQPERDALCFMEMNTRLQVEHPVTEATTGLDLVGLQLAIARGEKLPAAPPPSRGWAIEARLCAEDPERNFAPAPGLVKSFRSPVGPGVRTDSGVREGDRIPVEFDSMVAKLIAHGETREQARSRLRRALLETLLVVDGGSTNRAFLLRLLEHPDFIEGKVDTGWIDRLIAKGFLGEEQPGAYAALLATAIELHERQLHEEELNFFAAAARGRPALPAQQRRPIELRYRGEGYEFRVSTLEPGSFRVQVDGRLFDVKLEHDGPYEKRLCYDTPQGLKRHRLVSVPSGLDYLVEVDGAAHRVSRDPGGLLRAPAPGLVLQLHVREGAQVKAGERLLALEAMKMEMPVTAPFDGRVRQVLVGESLQVNAGDPLVVLEPEVREGEDKRAGDRVQFPIGDADATASRSTRAALRELRRLMLGFDIGADRIAELLARLSATFEGGRSDSEPPDFDTARSLLTLFLDVESLFSKQYSGTAAARRSPEQNLHTYLREYRSEGKGLPEEFLTQLKAALAHYGVSGLGESSRLKDALVWLHRSHQNLALKGRAVVFLLSRCLSYAGWRDAARDPSFKELLARLVSLTQESQLSVCEAAQAARYGLFEGSLLKERRREALERVDASLEQLRRNPDSLEREELIAELVAKPLGLMGHLAPMIGEGDDTMRKLVLEVLTRRIYRTQALTEPRIVLEGGRIHLVARCQPEGKPAQLVAAYTDLIDVDAALHSMAQVAGQLPVPVQMDLYVGVPRAPDEEADAALIARKLSPLPAGHVSRVCVTFIHPGRQLQMYTLLASEKTWAEDESLRGFHPATGERLELWRMRNFNIKRVATSEDLYLFHAKARQNERDERLFAVGEVRELHPLRDGTGHLVAIPEMEHALLEALQAIREQQARRDARRRLHWNRVTLFLRAPLMARREELLNIARRLEPSWLQLGLEKIAVRVFLQEDASQPPRDTVVSLSDRTGHRLEIALSEPHEEALRGLDDYNLKLIRARQKRLTYVYEIVKMLAPAEASADFPGGEFEEFDLSGEGDKLVSVKGRPYGENRANVVVGLIKNFTAKHPEGMTRVLLLGDGTRDMGALAEPECRRIISAIDLAQSLSVPLEWFPISSGAKIAMDSGTENLDWTAAVLRRIVEFSQLGGEINVVVDGINVGAQSYWNAEATMLMHCRGCLIMTPRGSMLLTGKRALDYSGGISAEDNLGIGGFERIMGPNGQAQYHAHDLDEACRTLLRHYEHSYIAPGERHPRQRLTSDTRERNVCQMPYRGPEGFAAMGELWSDEKNPGRKKPFDVRLLMRALCDQDAQPLERWPLLRDGEVSVVWDAHLGGWPVCMIGIESKPLPRVGYVPSDGPESWSGGTLFPLGSKKVARAISSASGNRPVVLLANLSGFDGSPESLRRLQLEYGAEIGRAVVNFKGPLVFCVVARYHGGAYVVFSKALNPELKVMALSGSYASVIGGAPAAAVVFPEEARALAMQDPRVAAMDRRLKAAGMGRSPLSQEREELFAKVRAEKARELAEKFDSIHSVQRALQVGSLDAILEPAGMRPALIEAVESALAAGEPHRKAQALRVAEA